MKDKSLLREKSIINILIGDTTLYEKDSKKYSLPYLSGPTLCEISTRLGLTIEYSWNGGAWSRWMYLEALIDYLNEDNRVGELLSYLFDIKQFDYILDDVHNIEDFKDIHHQIINNAVGLINLKLCHTHKELKCVNNNWCLVDVLDNATLPVMVESLIDINYIRGLLNRTEDEFINRHYDSVVTKSRTLIEEVIISILEARNIDVPTSGNLKELYKECKTALGMKIDKSWDKWLLEMLNGLEKIVNSISDMRNNNSDAHGVGSARVPITHRETRLIINSTITFCEYIWEVHESQCQKVERRT